MDEESDTKSKVTISDLAEKAAAKEPEPKPKKRIGLGIMLTVLVLLLVGGALAAGYLWGNNTVKPIDDNAQSSSSKTNNKTTTEPESSTSTDIVKDSVISVAEAEKILEKYIGTGNGVQAIPYSAFYSTFSSNFDDQQKAFLAYGSIDRDEKENIECVDERYEQGLCSGRSISYELINKKYQSLFGDYSTIEKQNYSFKNFIYLVYDDKIDAYREFVFAGGGTTPVVAVHKVVSVEKSGENMVVTLILAHLKTDIEVPSGTCGPTWLNIGTSSVDEMVESMSLYEFTLSPYSDSYVLTAVNKIEQ